MKKYKQFILIITILVLSIIFLKGCSKVEKIKVNKKLLTETPPLTLLEYASPFYTDAFTNLSPYSEEIKKLHEELVSLIIKKTFELDKNYEKLLEEIDKYDANLLEIYGVWSKYGRTHKELFRKEEELIYNLAILRTFEEIERVYIKEIKKKIKEVKSKSDNPNHSLTYSNLISHLLYHYATLTQFYSRKIPIILSKSIIYHEIEKNKINKDLRKKLEKYYKKEKEIAERIIDLTMKTNLNFCEIYTALQGLNEFFKEVVKFDIEYFQRKIPLYEIAILKAYILGRKNEAMVTSYGLQIFKDLSLALENVYNIQAKKEIPLWIEYTYYFDTLEYKFNFNPLGIQNAYAGEWSSKFLSRLKSIVNQTKDAVKSVKSVFKSVMKSVGRGTEVVRKIVTLPLKYGAYGADVATRMASDTLCGVYYYGINKKGLKMTFNQVMEGIKEINEDWKEGKKFEKIMKYGERIFTESEKIGRVAFEYLPKKVLGEGWISKTAAFLGETAVGVFTSFGKGVTQIANPKSSKIKIFEGITNITLSVVSFSEAFTGIGTKINKTVCSILSSISKKKNYILKITPTLLNFLKGTKKFINSAVNYIDDLQVKKIFKSIYNSKSIESLPKILGKYSKKFEKELYTFTSTFRNLSIQYKKKVTEIIKNVKRGNYKMFENLINKGKVKKFVKEGVEKLASDVKEAFYENFTFRDFLDNLTPGVISAGYVDQKMFECIGKMFKGYSPVFDQMQNDYIYTLKEEKTEEEVNIAYFKDMEEIFDFSKALIDFHYTSQDEFYKNLSQIIGEIEKESKVPIKEEVKKLKVLAKKRLKEEEKSAEEEDWEKIWKEAAKAAGEAAAEAARESLPSAESQQEFIKKHRKELIQELYKESKTQGKIKKISLFILPDFVKANEKIRIRVGVMPPKRTKIRLYISPSLDFSKSNMIGEYYTDERGILEITTFAPPPISPKSDSEGIYTIKNIGYIYIKAEAVETGISKVEKVLVSIGGVL
ncbi:MAG: hypothetical protein OD816_001390 [Thermodesulfobacterium sp.]|uniref:Uncharacterized protein n=1 Tax=Candidatus Thermodesulfobacterium syntrophicum TaxID=3060442 RepID=A0AAE3P4W7_9BACT|nr:hypothetical protein [Candidatus Thermodesulfobacterium syntrophicum]